MKIYVLQQSSEYNNYWFIKDFDTREQAIEYVKNNGFHTPYEFIEGDRLKLALRTVVEDNNLEEN